MSTMQDVLDLSRQDLNDAAKVRFTDDVGIKYANDGVARVYELRPDLAYGTYGTAYADLTTASSFPLPIEFRAKVANYVSYRFLTADDAFTSDQQGTEMYQLFVKEVLGA